MAFSPDSSLEMFDLRRLLLYTTGNASEVFAGLSYPKPQRSISVGLLSQVQGPQKVSKLSLVYKQL